MQKKDFGVIQKVFLPNLLIFNLLSSCSSLFILHAGCLLILESKIEELKERKKLFFCKLKIKDGNVFYTDIYL